MGKKKQDMINHRKSSVMHSRAVDNKAPCTSITKFSGEISHSEQEKPSGPRETMRRGRSSGGSYIWIERYKMRKLSLEWKNAECQRKMDQLQRTLNEISAELSRPID